MSAREAHDTRDRLLKSALEVFADKGYSNATVAEICDQAGANLAAVNYHFQSKENLYVEAWRLAFSQAIETHPPDGGVAPDASAEERLGGRILSLVNKFLDPDCRVFEIIHKELANPTGLLEDAKRESIQPIIEQMRSIVSELLGPGATDSQVDLCQMSIMSQCFHILVRGRHRKELARKDQQLPRPFLREYDADVMADHIFKFSLAGINEVRKRVEKS